MATETATIRVARGTRDLLAAQARRQGMSVSQLLSTLANEAEREIAFRSEREASAVDARNPEVEAEEREWEATLDDGVD